MPRIILLLMLSIALLSPTGKTQQQQPMEDPLFGISYNPNKVRFEPVTTSLSEQCTELRTKYDRAWIYGHWKGVDAEYFIVSGLAKFHHEESGAPYVAPDFGTAVELTSSRCISAHIDYLMLGDAAVGTHPFVGLNDTILAHISEDALERYAKAFGGKINFLDHLPKKNRDNLPPALQKQLEIFEKHP